MNREVLERLNGVIESTLIKNSKNPDDNAGASICILHKGKEVFYGEYGERDMENHIPMTRDAIFRCYSMTKPITSVAVMSLVEKGKISLADPVHKYIPGFKDQKVLTKDGLVPVERDVNLQHLMNMTAGVVYPDMSFPAGEYMENVQKKYYEDLEKGIETSTLELANIIGKQPLEFQPGTAWRYGFCADVLGAVIEVVTGMRFSDYLKETIFEPLDMKDTDFYVPEEKQDRLMVNYEYKWDQGVMAPCTWQHLCLSHFHLKKPAFESGGAGLVSTIDDYSHFCMMLLNHGTYKGKRILGRKTLEWMTKNQLGPEELKTYNWDDKKGYGYANLLRVMISPQLHEGLGSEGEYGWDGWLGTYMLIDPKEDLGVIYVIQKCGGNGYRDVHIIRDVIYSALSDDQA